MMTRYRKKPVVIDAVQLRWDNWGEMCDFLGEAFFTGGGRGEPAGGDPDRIGLLIPTLEGLLHASQGDWIIRGVKGELYSCKPDIFDATYEPAEDGWPPGHDALRTLLRETAARVTALETIHRAISERHDEELGPMDAQFPRACGCPDCLLIDASLGSAEPTALAARVAEALGTL